MSEPSKPKINRRLFLKLAAAGGCAMSAANAGATGQASEGAGGEVIKPIFDGRHAEEWDTERDAIRLDREFSFSQVAESPQGNALIWRFTPRAGTTFNDLWWNKPINHPFTAIRVRLKNDGAALTFAAKTRDADGSEWTTAKVPLPAHSGWRRVTFPFEQWRVASWSIDADGRLDFPLGCFVMIAFDLQPNIAYDLKVARVDLVRPAPPVATIHRFTLPSVMRHGGEYSASLVFDLNKPCYWDAAALNFTLNGKTMFRVPIPLATPLTLLAGGKRVDAPNIPVKVPEYAYGGRYQVRLELGDAVLKWETADAKTGGPAVEITARKPVGGIARVAPHNGVPTLHINDHPQSGMVYTAYGPSVKVFSEFARAGVRLYSFAATPTESNYGLAKTAWLAPGQYNFAQLDERVMMVLQAEPNAHFFPRLYLDAPKWWLDQHPNDVVLLDPGDGRYTPFISPGNNQAAPSWASEAWRTATIEGLRHLIAHVEASPYSDRCIGYHLASGTTEEWMMWGANENEWVDYSPVNQSRFRNWLRTRYGSVRDLQNAWHDNNVTFETASIPTKRERERCDFGSLRDPAKEQTVIDFYLYNSYLVADTITTLAHAVKEITHRRKIVGVFYGYLLQLCGEQRQQNAGHLALKQVLASPDLDFLCSPTSYAFRELGGAGTSHFMSLLGSVHLHGKMWFDENDIRTSLSGGQVGMWGRPKDVAGDILQQSKELANVITNGAGQWWFDVGGNRYDSPELMAEIGRLTRDATDALKLNRAPVDEVAMVVDENSLCYLRVGDPLGRWLLLDQLPDLLRIGAPVGEYLVEDLPRLNDHKLLLFMTSFAPTDAERQTIEKMKGAGRVLVFLYAPGIYRNGRLDPAAMSELTGIQLKISEKPALLQLTLSGNHPLTENLNAKTIGVNDRTFPWCYADDPQAATLGTMSDGRAGLVMKHFGGWTSIFSSAPMLPRQLLRNMAKLAGVHFYLDTPDVVWASQQMLAVCVDQAGPRRINLRKPATVRDLYRDEIIGRDVKGYAVNFEALSTRLFGLE